MQKLTAALIAVRQIGKRNMGRVRLSIRTSSRKINPWFHWKFSGVLIPGFFGTALGLALASRFRMSYAFWILFGLWTIGFWLTSKTLHDKLAETHRREVRRDATRLREATSGYRRSKYTVVAVILLATGLLIRWTESLENEIVAKELQQARDDVYDHLTVQPIGTPITNDTHTQTVEFSILNNGHPDMTDHTVQCVIHAMWNGNQMGFHRGALDSPEVFHKGLLGGGHGETVRCSTGIGFEEKIPVLCMDVFMQITFAAVGQSEAEMKKLYRFSYDVVRTAQPWVQESPNDEGDYCEGYYQRSIQN